jgi:hypothetical protein
MKLSDTVIETGGVLRCCIGSVAMEKEGMEFEIGAKSICQHCQEPFTLVARPGKKPKWMTPKDWAKPIWKPDWQLTDDFKAYKPLR